MEATREARADNSGGDARGCIVMAFEKKEEEKDDEESREESSISPRRTVLPYSVHVGAYCSLPFR